MNRTILRAHFYQKNRENFMPCLQFFKRNHIHKFLTYLFLYTFLFLTRSKCMNGIIYVEIKKHINKWNTFNTIYLWKVAGMIRASKDRFKLILPHQNMYLA